MYSSVFLYLLECGSRFVIELLPWWFNCRYVPVIFFATGRFSVHCLIYVLDGHNVVYRLCSYVQCTLCAAHTGKVKAYVHRSPLN